MNQPLHICHIEWGRHVYGGPGQVLYLIDGLQQHGVQNTVVCEQGSAFAASARATGARVIELSTLGDIDVRVRFTLPGVLKKINPSLVHIHSRRLELLSAWSVPRTTPLIISRRVDNLEPTWLATRKYARAAAVIAISEGIGRVVQPYVPSSKCHVIADGVDIKRFKPGDMLPEHHQTLAVVAQLIPRKGHKMAFDAFKTCLAHFPSAKLLVYGKGPLEQELKTYVNTLGIASSVQFMGFVTDMPNELAKVGAVVHPATSEGLGVALLETAACAKPVIATNVGGIGEIVNNNTGWLISKDSLPELERAMLEYLESPNEAKRRGQAARAHIEKHFSVKAMVAGNYNLYKSILR